RRRWDRPRGRARRGGRRPRPRSGRWGAWGRWSACVVLLCGGDRGVESVMGADGVPACSGAVDEQAGEVEQVAVLERGERVRGGGVRGSPGGEGAGELVELGAGAQEPGAAPHQPLQLAAGEGPAGRWDVADRAGARRGDRRAGGPGGGG